MDSEAGDSGFRHFVSIYRCDVVTSSPFVAALDNVKVELFREERTYRPSEYRNLVAAAVEGAVYCSPVHPPIKLDARSQHLVLTTRTRLERSEAQEGCESAIDRVVATLSAIFSPELFRTLLFRGWLRGPRGRELGALFKGVRGVEIQGKGLARDYSAAVASIARTSLAGDRFALMSRFIAKGLAEPPNEEAYVWLWTALEVFPMVNTTDIKPISEFLSPYVGRAPAVVKEKLRIGWLFGMRSRLVHDGHLPLNPDERFSALARLEHVVRAVVRHASGLPYDRSFDSAFQVK